MEKVYMCYEEKRKLQELISLSGRDRDDVLDLAVSFLYSGVFNKTIKDPEQHLKHLFSINWSIKGE